MSVDSSSELFHLKHSITNAKRMLVRFIGCLLLLAAIVVGQIFAHKLGYSWMEFFYGVMEAITVAVGTFVFLERRRLKEFIMNSRVS